MRAYVLVVVLSLPAVAYSMDVDRLQIKPTKPIPGEPLSPPIAVSADGLRWAVTLGGPQNVLKDCFLFNPLDGTQELISAAPDGSELNKASHCVGVSVDANRVAFISQQQPREGYGFYVFDRTTKSTSRFDACPNGNPNKVSGMEYYNIAMNRSGTKAIARYSDSCTGNNGSTYNIKVVIAEGAGGQIKDTPLPALSRGFTFSSVDALAYMTRPVGANLGVPWHLMIYNLATGQEVEASTDAVGGSLDDDQLRGTISGNGRYALIMTKSDKLVAGDYNGKSDIFIKDIATGEIELVSRTPRGRVGNDASWGFNVMNSPGNNMGIDDTGRYVIFTSKATNLTPQDVRGTHCYVYDRQSKKNTLVDKNVGGVPGDDICAALFISSNPVRIIFMSGAKNLTPAPAPSRIFLAE